MPTVPHMPPASRFFARLDKFECACPSCGRLIFNGLDARQLPKRLRCPWCFAVFIAGLLLYPVRPGTPRPTDAPPDARPDAHERAEMRRLGEGYFLDSRWEPEQPVNLFVTRPCSCPPGAWTVTCPVHGDPAQLGAKVGA